MAALFFIFLNTLFFILGVGQCIGHNFKTIGFPLTPITSSTVPGFLFPNLCVYSSPASHFNLEIFKMAETVGVE
jgi:hypothetical protein